MARRILIADNEKNFCAVVEELLTAAGYEVEAVGDGLEALAAVERHPPALMLLDLRMPILDGLGVLERLQGNGRGFPIVVVSAVDDASEAALARGAACVLIKPFGIDVLLDAVRAFA
jgi:two-component system response regulator MprA